MASTYSTNLAIELIGTGDQAGTWGNTTNTNLGTLIEQAISGYVTQAVSTGTDTTITIPNGATGVARNMYIELTGTGGASTNLIVPANKKLYFIFNNTSSGQVTVKVSGQTGVSVPNKAKVILVSDGTDIIDATNYIGSAVIGNITATSGTITTLASTSAIITTLTSTSAGITTLSSGSANITQLNSTSGTISTLASTSAAITTLSGTTLTYASASITNLTATSLVLSNLSIASANITTLTSSSATISTTLVLSGGTANGVLYLNGSKVATSGSALTFDGTNFATTGTITSGGSYNFNTTSGRDILWGTGSYTYITGNPGTGVMAFGIANTEQMRLTSTGLGIGTSSPASKLHVSGAAAKLYVDLGGNNYYQATDQIWQNYGGGTEYMRLTSTGLGIGTSSPAGRLHVVGSSATTTSLLERSTASTAVPVFSSRSLATSSGDMADGFGPTHAFAIQDGAAVINPIGEIGAVREGADNSGGLIFRTYSAGTATTQMRLDSSGNLGIGTSSPETKFVVSGSGSEIASLVWNTSGSSTNTAALYLSAVASGPALNRTAAIKGIIGTSNNHSLAFFTNPDFAAPVERMRITSAGDVGIGTSSPSGFLANKLVIATGGTANEGMTIYSSSNNGSIWFADATTGTGRYAGGLDYTHSDDTLIFYSAAQGNMRLNASGNLGLGVTPSAWLNTRAFDIGTFGAVSCDTATSGVLSLAYNAYAEGASTWKYKGAGAAGLYQQTEAHKWFTAASGTAGNTISFTQAMTLDASGQLALGTSTASTTLGRNITINGANAGTNTGILLQSAGTERGYLYGSDSQVVFGSSTSIPAVFVTGGTERARITSGGDFGIGTTSPGQKLEVVGNIFINSSGNPYMEIKTSGAGNNPYLRLTASSTYWDIAGIFSDSTDPLQFAYGGSEKARIDSSGNLLVGKTTTSGTSGVGLLMAYDSASPTYVIVGSTSTSAANCIQAYSTGAGAYRFYVDYAGTVFATNTTISAISDQRFKENICDLDVGLDAVLALKPRKFDWKEGKGKDVKNDRGFIAQEFEQVFPDLVDEWKDPAPEGEEPYKSVRQDLIPVLVKAIQEQQAMINDLKAKVAALESK